MVVVVSRLGLVAFSTVPLLMVPVPVLAPAGVALTAAAAATCEGLLKTVLKVAAAWAVGWMRNWSPDAGVPVSTMDNPSALSGLAGVPEPVNSTALPVAAFVSE